MNEETFEALKRVVEGARFYLNRKYGDRKRLSQDEVWEKATLTRDLVAVENWIDEVAKDYDEVSCLHSFDDDGICKTCGYVKKKGQNETRL